MNFVEPPHNCQLCPRLAEFRKGNQQKFPDKFNAPVPAFGGLDAKLLVVGLAPGLKGANFSGRPFTGDYAGDLLYPTLIKFGFAKGEYHARPDDGLELTDARITNAVRCVPPQNKTIGQEENACRPFLISEINAMPNLKVILSLGLVSHNAVLRTFGEKLSAHKFGHGAIHSLSMPSPRKRGSTDNDQTDPRLHGESKKITLLDSYHCSRYNTNTGRLTTEMFEDVFEKITRLI